MSLDHIRLRKRLNDPSAARPLPEGVRLVALSKTSPTALHALLQAGYAAGGGYVPAFETWWQSLVEDDEFDPHLVIVAAVGDEPVGVAQCWTSGFVKDLVVAPAWRDRGLGAALLTEAFSRFATRGAPNVDLKVEADNVKALRFYRRLGMVEV